MKNKSVKMKHTFKERNQLADLFTNPAFDFVGYTNL